MASPAKLVGLGATICSLSGTADLMSIIFDWQLLIGLGPLLSLLPVWNRDIQGKDRCRDRDCCACDPPSAAVMVLEDWDGEHRQREQQAEPGSDHTDPMADPPGHVFAVLALELRSTRAMGQKLREEDDHEGHACAGVKIVWRHLQCLSVHRLRQAGQTLDPQTIACANPVDSDTTPAAAGMNPAASPACLPGLNHKLSLQARREQ
jgi:hypothetical protein